MTGGDVVDGRVERARQSLGGRGAPLADFALQGVLTGT